MTNFELIIEEGNSYLVGEIDSYLDRVQDWESNLDEHILYMSSLENWDHEQELGYILKQELEFRRQGEELLYTVLTQLSEITNYERAKKYHYRLSENDKSNLLSVDLDRHWVNSDTFSLLHEEGLCDDKLRCIFDDLEHEVVQQYGTYTFDTFVAYNPEIESWLSKWKGIIFDHYHGDQFKEGSCQESVL